MSVMQDNCCRTEPRIGSPVTNLLLSSTLPQYISMSQNCHNYVLPNYRGKKWVCAELPTQGQTWQIGKRHSSGKELPSRQAMVDALAQSTQFNDWQWPDSTIYFMADPHADTEAFLASLVASGGIQKTGPEDDDFKLTKAGAKASFIIGGDCLDKGPSNLRLLRSIRHLMNEGANVRLLAGNHDLRLLLGIRAMGMRRDPKTEHFFLRMGPKVVPLLKEVHEEYLKGRNLLRHIPSSDECKRRLYPSDRWFDEFPRYAQWVMSERAVERELSRIKKKYERFEQVCEEAGLSMRKVYATARKCQELFFEKNSEFYWFYNTMQLAHREGSFLFIHAGIDDRIAKVIEDKGIEHLNKLYRRQIKNDLFEFYYGPLANTIRTKYRVFDMPLTQIGVDRVYRYGIQAIVQGHRNRRQGQRLKLRKGLVHIESDTTMDCNSRQKEGLDGKGFGVTILRPKGQVIGISADYPYAKFFELNNLILQNIKT